MPIYEYQCTSCGKAFEELVMNQSAQINCPKCNGADVKKMMSAAAFKSSDKFVSSSTASGCSSCATHNCGSCGSS